MKYIVAVMVREIGNVDWIPMRDMDLGEFERTFGELQDSRIVRVEDLEVLGTLITIDPELSL